jgi:serine/threonine-protein kinase
LAIASLSLLGTTLVGTGFWLLLMAVLIFAQSQRWIERVDLIIIAVITLAIVLFFSPLRDFALIQAISNPIQAVLLLAALAALVAVAVTIVFQLIYRILSNLF